MACGLFNICLSIFLSQDRSIGRVIALDEAHKYMGESAECQVFTNTLLTTIRVQRHEAARIIISTQEPTISPKLLDLCTVTIVHRFSSPDWLNTIKAHLAGMSTVCKAVDRASKSAVGFEEGASVDEGARALDITMADPAAELFTKIVGLRVGEALLFAPSAAVSVQREPYSGKGVAGTGVALKRLGHDVLKVRIRKRLTADGGRSIMAV